MAGIFHYPQIAPLKRICHYEAHTTFTFCLMMMLDAFSKRPKDSLTWSMFTPWFLLLLPQCSLFLWKNTSLKAQAHVRKASSQCTVTIFTQFNTLTPARTLRLHGSVATRCRVIWRWSSARLHSLHNSIHPPEMEINPLKMACGVG